LSHLAVDIQYRCQQFFFGEMAINYFAEQNKEFVQRRRSMSAAFSMSRKD